jgi:signal transduction histidine kinase
VVQAVAATLGGPSGGGRGLAPSCRLIGNRDTLEQVLLHLVQNAIDASEPWAPGGLKVGVEGSMAP